MKPELMTTGTASSGHNPVNQKSINPKNLAVDFPMLSRQVNDHRLVYLDNAATTQKPISVLDALDKYYRLSNANVHRGLHTLAEEATELYEQARDKTAKFIGGAKREEIIFTRGTTESINLVAHSYGEANIKAGDRIVITQMEHHANLIPWIMLAKKTGAELEYIPIDKNGYLELKDINNIINPRTKIVALTQMSNLLGTINRVEEIISLAHKKNAVVLIDGAQSIPHMQINIKDLNPDFFVFSAHKMLGPTGLGILYGREELLNEMEPNQFGGEMIAEVTFSGATWHDLPWKFEAGTPHIAGAAAFGASLDYLGKIGMEAIRRHEVELTEYALDRFSELPHITIFGPLDANNRGGLISFVDDKIHPHDMATFLDSLGVAVRAGHHCAQPLTRLLGEIATTRASFYIYNDRDDIDTLIEAIKEARRYFGHG